MSMKQAFLIVCYGTNDSMANSKAVARLKKKLRQKFAGCSFYCAYTHVGTKTCQKTLYAQSAACKSSQTGHLKGAQTFSQVMEKMLADGVTDVWIVPTYVLDGLAYRHLQKTADSFQGQFVNVWIGKPLLYDDSDYRQVANGLAHSLQQELNRHTAVILAGHGTLYSEYAKRLNSCFAQLGYSQFWVGMLPGRSALAGTRAWRRSLELHLVELRRQQYDTIMLLPLMFAVGKHAREDVAGDTEDSWKTICLRAGFCVQCKMRGLGERNELVSIYVQHVQEMMQKENKS